MPISNEDREHLVVHICLKAGGKVGERGDRGRKSGGGG